MVSVYVPSFRKVGGDHERSFTVFCIEVFVNGRRTMLEKRYTEFEELHKKLKKQIRTPEFPPKKVLRWSSKVLEHRRQGFENYLQIIINRNSRVPSLLLQFLNVNDFNLGSQDSLDRLDTKPSITHQAVLAFEEEVFLQAETGGLPDIITAGAIQGLYDSTDSLKS